MAVEFAHHQQNAVGGRIDCPGGTHAGDRESALEQALEQSAAKLVR
jgi:hypothetical protein